MTSSLTVYYEGPFWVAVAETEIDGRYAVARVVLGGEPTGAEMREWVLREFCRLSFRVVEDANAERIGPRLNPKRLQREAAAAKALSGPTTRAQEALKEVMTQVKAERRLHAKTTREEERARRYACRVKRRKEKKRGH